MWQPLAEDKLLDMIDNAEWMMEPPVRAVWDRIKIQPNKWKLSPHGDMGGGFWVVALVGQWCLYYNDIEEGFNGSEWEQFGRISTYWCNQPNLLSFVTGYYRDLTEVFT